MDYPYVVDRDYRASSVLIPENQTAFPGMQQYKEPIGPTPAPIQTATPWYVWGLLGLGVYYFFNGSKKRGRRRK